MSEDSARPSLDYATPLSEVGWTEDERRISIVNRAGQTYPALTVLCSVVLAAMLIVLVFADVRLTLTGFACSLPFVLPLVTYVAISVIGSAFVQEVTIERVGRTVRERERRLFSVRERAWPLEAFDRVRVHPATGAGSLEGRSRVTFVWGRGRRNGRVIAKAVAHRLGLPVIESASRATTGRGPSS